MGYGALHFSVHGLSIKWVVDFHLNSLRGGMAAWQNSTGVLGHRVLDFMTYGGNITLGTFPSLPYRISWCKVFVVENLRVKWMYPGDFKTFPNVIWSHSSLPGFLK